jgi:hypothetical protein
LGRELKRIGGGAGGESVRSMTSTSACDGLKFRDLSLRRFELKEGGWEVMREVVASGTVDTNQQPIQVCEEIIRIRSCIETISSLYLY